MCVFEYELKEIVIKVLLVLIVLILFSNINTKGTNSIVVGNNNSMTASSISSLNNSNNNNNNNNNNTTMTMDPLEPIPVQHMNELFISSKEALLERMEVYTSTSNNWSD